MAKRGRKPVWPPTIHTRDGKDWIRLRVNGRTRDITLGPAGSDESRAEYARILAETSAGSPGIAGGITAVEVCVAYCEWAQGYHESRTYARIRRALRPVVELYGHLPAAEFGPVALRTCVARWVEEGLSRSYCNALRKCVVRCYRWAAGRELVPVAVPAGLACVEPLRKGKTSAREVPPVRAADREAVEATLPHLPRVVADMVRLQLLTGMRPGEVCVLRPCDLDRAWKAIGGEAWWLYRLDQHKTGWRGCERWVPISPTAQRLLAPYLDRDPASYCFSPRERMEALWNGLRTRRKRRRRKANPQRTPGDCYAERVYAAAVRRGCLQAGVVPWSPNQLRHLVGTEIETHLGREDARCVLGHSSPKTTSIYVEGVERAARALAALEARKSQSE